MSGTLKRFLLTGRLGPLVLGMTPDGVRSALGEPENVSLSKSTLVWRYGALDLTFLDGTLEVIGVEFEPGRTLPAGLICEGYVPTETTTREEFRVFLRGEGIDCFVDSSLTFPSQVCFAVGPGVSVVFSTSPDRIDSLWYTKVDRRRRKLLPCSS